MGGRVDDAWRRGKMDFARVMIRLAAAIVGVRLGVWLAWAVMGQ